MSSVYLLIGENTYERLQHVKKWKTEFIAKHGTDNILQLYADDISFTDTITEASSLPFIASKRLLIIHDIPKWTEEQWKEFYAAVHTDVLVLFVTEKLDKRLKTHKLLLEVSTHIECKVLDNAAIKRWIAEYVSQLERQIDSITIDFCVESLGTDQLLIASELEKVALYVDKTITIDSLQTVMTGSIEKEIWGLESAISKRQVAECLLYVRRLYRQGETAHGVWSITCWILSQICIMVGAALDGASSSNECMTKYKVSFNPAKNLWPLAKKLSSHPNIAQFFARIGQIEVAIKTGDLQTTSEDETELMSALDSILIEICTM